MLKEKSQSFKRWHKSNEQIRGFIAPLTRLLEELTRLVQGMITSRHPNSYPRTELGTTSGTAMLQSDSVLLIFHQVCILRKVISFSFSVFQQISMCKEANI